MRVLLMRHGIAIEREHQDCPDDPDRYLTDQGIARTRKAARGLRRMDVRPGRIWTSPWRRAAETAEICRETLGLDPEQLEEVVELRPDAGPERMLARLRGLDEDELLLVGHAPLLDEIVSALLGPGTAPVTSLKKAGVVSMGWSDTSDRGWIEWLLPPRVLRRLARS